MGALSRRATVTLLYNGVDATEAITPDLAGFSYTDVASGQSDSIRVELTDKQRRWLGPWRPQKGDTLRPIIHVYNWTSIIARDAARPQLDFPCGAYHVDDFSFSGGPPVRLTIEALAMPADSGFRHTSRTVTYEDATLEEIGERVAERAGIALYYDAPRVKVRHTEQTNQADSAFYSTLVESYGYQVKVYDDRIVVFSEAEYEAKPPKVTLTEADMRPSWSYNTTLQDVYTGVSYQYTETDRNETYTVEAGTGPRILTVNTAAGSLSEAQTIALAAVNAANRGQTTMSVTVRAIPGLIATDTVEIAGLQSLDGVYYIEQVTHTVGAGYTMQLELRKVEPRLTAADVTKAIVTP